MSYFGTIQVGRLTLRETFAAGISRDNGQITLSLKGQESSPPLTTQVLRQRREDILSLAGKFLPVTFTDKSELNGFYTIDSASADFTSFPGELGLVDWNLSATLIGPDNAVDVSSRLTTITRANNFSLAGESWHAPPGGAYGYFTGTTQPATSVVRSSTDGPLTVYRGLPASVSPRWAVALPDYGKGRVRVSVGFLERSATGVALDPDDWSITNGLVKVVPGTSSTLEVSSWDGTSWEPVTWNVSLGAVGSTALSAFDAASIIRNEYEMVTVRLMKTRAPGRIVLDITLRRGSRAVECVLQTDSSSTLSVWRATAEAGTSSTGYLVATANDAAGNKYVVGSAKTFTADTTQGGIAKTSATVMDFFIGSVVGGSSAVASDTASVIRDHYLKNSAETTTGVIR